MSGHGKGIGPQEQDLRDSPEEGRLLSDTDAHRTLSHQEGRTDQIGDGVKRLSLSDEDAGPFKGIVNGFLLGVAFVGLVLVVVWIVRLLVE